MQKTSKTLLALMGALALAAPAFAGPGPVNADSLQYKIDVEAFLPPVVTQQKLPFYSPRARLAGLEGQVVLTGRVDATGELQDLTVDTGPKRLRRAAMKAISQWQFEPATSRGEAIAVNVKVKVNFVLTDPNALDPPDRGDAVTTVSFSRLPDDPSKS